MDDCNALFDNFLPFSSSTNYKSRPNQQSKQIDELKQKLQQVQWENVELQQKLSRRPINKQDLSQIWKDPLITIQMVAEFIDRLPRQHKDKIWNRHANGDYIPTDKILNCIHSFVALCIKIKDRYANAPARSQIENKLLPFVQIIQTKLRSPNGLSLSEFHNDFQHWLLQPVTEFFISSHRQLKLKTKSLLSNKDRINNEFMTQCIERTANNVYGLSETMDILIDNSDYKQLQQIHDIIKSIKGDNFDDEKTGFLSMISPLYRLPPTCIIKMFMFLQRMDIKSLKLVSNDISILCMQHMNKYMFKVCNVNKLLVTPQLYTNIAYLNDDDLEIMNGTLYDKDKPFMELQFEWEETYEIPIKYQLIYKTKGGFQQKINKKQSIAEMDKSERHCFVFDKRNMIVMDEEDNKIETKVMDENDKISDYKMVVLQYFNVRKQCLYFKQVLLIHKNVILLADMVLYYILNAFIALNEDQRINNNELIKDLQINNTKLLIYKRVIDVNGNVLLSKQLKSNEKVIENNENNEEIILMLQMDKCETNNSEIEYKNNEERFCLNGNVFCDKLKSVFMLNVYYLHDSSLFKAYLQSLQSLKEEKDIKSLEYLLTLIPDGNILLNSFKMNCFTNYGTMRIKIAKMLDELVDPKCIQLFRKNDNNSFDILPWNMNTHQYVRDKCIYFDFMTNDNNIDDDDTKIDDNNPLMTYYIKIFTPEQCKIPLMGTQYYDKIKTTLIIKYAHKFVFGKTFIDYISGKIRSSIYGQCFNEILNIKNGENNDDILYALHKGNRTYFMDDEFVGDKDELKVNVLYLFMYKNPNNIGNDNASKTILITMRFWQTKNEQYDEQSSKYYSGVPVKIWIQDGEILGDILKRDLYEQSSFIHKIYKYEMGKMIVVDEKIYKPKKDDLFVLQVVNKDLFS